MNSDSAEQLFVRIYIDEHATTLLAPALRRRGYEAQSCVEANTLGWDDEQHLVYASERRMALLTSDASDFISIARRWYTDRREHAGIIITPVFSRRQIGTLLRLTLQLLDKLTADELHNTIIYLQQFE